MVNEKYMKKVLWVDKNIELIAPILEEKFKNGELEICSFKQFDVAYKYLSENRIDFIISGHHTYFSYEKVDFVEKSKKTCIPFFKQVKKNFKNIPIVLFSSLIKDCVNLAKNKVDLKNITLISKDDPECFDKLKYLILSENCNTSQKI